MTNKIDQLRFLMKKEGIAVLLLPNQDEFHNEYLPAHNKRVEWLTGFTGSAATVIITNNQNYFFTDGRYMLQAKKELNKDDYKIYDTKLCTIYNFLLQHNIKDLWYDPCLHTEREIAKYNNIKLKPVSPNPIDVLWQDRPKFIQSHIKDHEEYAGESSIVKCKKLAGDIPFLLTKPDSICWLLNIRGNDVKHNPLIMSYAILYPNGQVDLFLQHTQEIVIGQHVTQYEFGELKNILSNIPKISFDPSFTSVYLTQLISPKAMHRKNDPCQLAKACKNAVEIEGAKKAHVRDGVAMAEFLYWLSSNRFSEKSAATKLLELRKKQELFQEESFPSIAGFASNGAIIHNTQCNDKIVDGDNFFLVDSGGQYLDGTTDVTRTIAVGNITNEQKRYYTLVLKGHIALATAIFPVGTTGKQLDVLARQYLWSDYANYNHGTGHGVGSYLEVHEGPHSMSNDVPLEVGMIISNEPGFYKEGNYGIRIESLMRVVPKNGGYLGFEVLTAVPIDLAIADKTLMTLQEIDWVVEYNKAVYEKISNKIASNVKKWIKLNFIIL